MTFPYVLYELVGIGQVFCQFRWVRDYRMLAFRDVMSVRDIVATLNKSAHFAAFSCWYPNKLFQPTGLDLSFKARHHACEKLSFYDSL